MAPKKANVYNFPAPIDSDILIGHEDVLRTFDDAWARRNEYPIHPVWMFCGTRGIGKSTLAHKIARGVYGNVGDFFIIDMERNIDKDGRLKTDGKQISVFTVRAMIEKLQLSSMSGGWRVVLVDSMDELNTAASNAMLKILEEPPANTIFLLITHQLARVLPTIRSRSRVEKMRPLKDSQLRELFYKFIPGEDLSQDLIKLANGSFGRIADLKRTGGSELYEDLLNYLNNPNANSADGLALAIAISKDNANFGILLDAVAHFGLADLYPIVNQSLNAIERVYLEPEIAIFKIINEIKKCL